MGECTSKHHLEHTMAEYGGCPLRMSYTAAVAYIAVHANSLLWFIPDLTDVLFSIAEVLTKLRSSDKRFSDG